MIKMVAHDGSSVVEKTGDLGIGPVTEDFLEEVRVIPAAGFDELLFGRGPLGRC